VKGGSVDVVYITAVRKPNVPEVENHLSTHPEI
jgi:hypothetical protein